MRVLVDTNILLDAVLVERTGHVEAALFLDMVQRGRIIGFVTPMAIGTVCYYAQKQEPRLGAEIVRGLIATLLDLLEWVPVLPGHFSTALASTFTDLEDGAQFFAAMSVGKIDAIVTRDPKDFKEHVHVLVITAAQCLKKLG